MDDLMRINHYKKKKRIKLLAALLFFGVLTSLIVINEKDKKKEQSFFEIQNQIHTIDAYRIYLSQYGENRRFSQQAKDSIYAIEKQEETELWESLSKQGLYQVYIDITKKGSFKKEAQLALENQTWEEAKKKRIYNLYLEKYPNGIFSKEAKELMEQMSWEAAKQKRNYQQYIDAYPKGKYISMAQELIENELWNTESKAWNEANKRNSINSFKKYLNLYPNGINSDRAEKRIIDKEVDDIFKGEYGTLPSMGRTSFSQGTYSTISVYNNTSYVLSLRYSGNDSKVITIPSQSRKSISLLNGNYRVTASVNASSVRNYAGTESLMGGGYDVTYYIQTIRY